MSSCFRDANGFYTSYSFAFLFDTLSGYRTILQKLIWSDWLRPKILDDFKIQHLYSNVEKCQDMSLVSVDGTRYMIFRLLSVNVGF